MIPRPCQLKASLIRMFLLRFRFSIDDSLHVRLSDSALSRDLFPNDYCCLADNINRPIKWMAMEAILTNQYTPASDMVSGSCFNTLLVSPLEIAELGSIRIQIIIQIN